MLNDVINIVIALIVALAAIVIIPSVRRFLESRHEQTQLEKIYTWAEKAVSWAQQVYWSDTGKMRHSVVMDVLKTVRDDNHINITDEQLEVLLEAAVHNLNDLMGVGYVSLEGEDGDE